jgi:transposase InsO family protein
MRLRELAASRVRFGYRRLTVLLKREGWGVNAKRIYRLYSEEGLTVRTKQRKKAASRQRVPLGLATKPNERRRSIHETTDHSQGGRSRNPCSIRSVHSGVFVALREPCIER